MSWLISIIPSKVKVYAVIVAAFAVLISIIKANAARAALTKAEVRGYRDAEKKRALISADRRDPKRLHPYLGRGFRDGASGK